MRHHSAGAAARRTPVLDDAGYPTDATLDRVRQWPFPFNGLLDYVRSAWRYADSGYWTIAGDRYLISTAGWSGNEALITALEENHPFWLLSWQESRRGGHHILDLSWRRARRAAS